MRLKAAVLFVIALALTACQSAPPPAAATAAKAVTYGDWTVRQGGYVRVESGVVR